MASDAETGSTAETRRAAIVFNPSKVPVAALRSAVAAVEASAGWAESAWFETSPGDDGRGAVLAAVAARPALVVVAGGDGTLRVAAESLAGTGIPIGLVPAGTGNLFARELGLPLNLRAAVDVAFTGRERPVDLARATLVRPGGDEEEHAFLVMAGIGLDAQMAARTNQRLKARIGWLAYSDPIARSILGNKQFDLTYALDDGPDVETRAHTVIVGNSGSLTAGMLLLPAAVVDDGMLDAVIMRPGRGAGWTDIGYRLAFNRVLHRTGFGRLVGRLSREPRAMRYAQARTLRVRFTEPQEIQLDGDPHGAVIAATLTVRYHALAIRVRADATT